MNNWLTFLDHCDATITTENYAVFSPSGADATELQTSARLMPLTHQGILKVSADKAIEFLQGQTTCDFQQLAPTRSLTGAQCNPKGRMLTSFRALQTADNEILLIMSTDLVAPTVDALNKFAPFFRATLEDSTNDYATLGLTGGRASSILAQQFGNIPSDDNETLTHNNVTITKISASCWQLILPFSELETLWSGLSVSAQPTGTEHWQLEMIRLGLGQVVAATREMFIPQMINLEAVGGISFKKGCYTGQEVVARMKYLGKLKRRMYHLSFQLDSVPEAGEACKLSAEGQSVGNIVAAVRSSNSSVHALAVLTAEAAAAGQLLIGEQQPVVFQLEALPYSLENS